MRRRSRSRDLGRRAEEAARGGDVQEGLVERQRLVERRHRLQDVEHAAADVGVDVEARSHHHGVGGQRRSAWAIGIALRTPNGRTSYEAASTTPRWA